MRKIKYTVLLLAFALAMAGCGSTKSTAQQVSASNTSAQPTPYAIFTPKDKPADVLKSLEDYATDKNSSGTVKYLTDKDADVAAIVKLADEYEKANQNIDYKTFTGDEIKLFLTSEAWNEYSTSTKQSNVGNVKKQEGEAKYLGLQKVVKVVLDSSLSQGLIYIDFDVQASGNAAFQKALNLPNGTIIRRHTELKVAKENGNWKISDEILLSKTVVK